jgi:hypothetical protein
MAVGGLDAAGRGPSAVSDMGAKVNSVWRGISGRGSELRPPGLGLGAGLGLQTAKGTFEFHERYSRSMRETRPKQDSWVFWSWRFRSTWGWTSRAARYIDCWGWGPPNSGAVVCRNSFWGIIDPCRCNRCGFCLLSFSGSLPSVKIDEDIFVDFVF